MTNRYLEGLTAARGIVQRHAYPLDTHRQVLVSLSLE